MATRACTGPAPTAAISPRGSFGPDLPLGSPLSELAGVQKVLLPGAAPPREGLADGPRDRPDGDDDVAHGVLLTAAPRASRTAHAQAAPDLQMASRACPMRARSSADSVSPAAPRFS